MNNNNHTEFCPYYSINKETTFSSIHEDIIRRVPLGSLTPKNHIGNNSPNINLPESIINLMEWDKDIQETKTDLPKSIINLVELNKNMNGKITNNLPQSIINLMEWDKQVEERISNNQMHSTINPEKNALNPFINQGSIYSDGNPYSAVEASHENEEIYSNRGYNSNEREDFVFRNENEINSSQIHHINTTSKSFSNEYQEPYISAGDYTKYEDSSRKSDNVNTVLSRQLHNILEKNLVSSIEKTIEEILPDIDKLIKNRIDNIISQYLLQYKTTIHQYILNTIEETIKGESNNFVKKSIVDIIAQKLQITWEENKL